MGRGVVRVPEVEAGHPLPLLVVAEAPHPVVARVRARLVLRAVLVGDAPPELDAAVLRVRVAGKGVEVVRHEADPVGLAVDPHRDPLVVAVVVDLGVAARRADLPVRVACPELADNRPHRLRLDLPHILQGLVDLLPLREGQVFGGHRRSSLTV